MSSFDKYRVHEVAKDFGLASKTIVEILTKYATAPKNHMQVLEDPELSLIFESLTQRNQCATMEELFKVPEPKPEAAQAAKDRPAQQQGKQAQPAAQQPSQAQGQPAQAAQQPAQQQAKPKEQKPHVPRQEPKKRVIDTRGGGNVNLGKYASTASPARTRAKTKSAARRSSRTARSSASSRPRPAPSAAPKSASACRSCSSR